VIARIVDSKTMRVIEVEDISQIVIFTATGEPVALAVHETPAGAIIAAHPGDQNFNATLKGLGVNPVALITM
jgi:hypothetical protein